VASLWWQGRPQAAKGEPGISANKVGRSSSALAFGLNAGRLLQGFSIELSRRKMMKEKTGASSANKSSGLCVDCTKLCPPFLACRGGEGERGWSFGAAAMGRLLGDLRAAGLDSVRPAIPKRRRGSPSLSLAAILASPNWAMEAPASNSSSMRKISVTGAALPVSGNPSGLVPGVVEDGRARRRFSGGAPDLDRVHAVVSRVQSVKFRGLVVFLFFVRSLL
jgi:hypothetical protein